MADEAKASLPVNHPQAGYVEPDLSAIDGREEGFEADLPEEEKPKTREERIEAREAEVKAIAEAEDKAKKEEDKAAAEEAEEKPKAEKKAAASA